MINPFLLNSEPSEPTPLAKLPENPLGDYNPFLSLVSEPVTTLPDAKSILYKNEPNYAPITVSTKQATPYIKKGFNVTDIDLKNPNFITDLSNTQDGVDRFTNNLKVAGANLISMAVGTGFSNPLDMVGDTESSLSDNTFSQKIFDWRNSVAQENINYETKDDLSNNLWTNLTNWLPFSSAYLGINNSTKGLGNLLESAAYGIGAGIGIAAQEMAVSFATGGSGTLPLLARNIQKLLNSSRYLSEALRVSGIAAKGANNLKNVVQAGEITNSVAKGLTKLYQSQLGSYSEALFEGLEGKESLKTQLIDDYEKVHGFKPIGEELDKIDKTATEAGADRVKLNRLLLSATNLSQFNSIFKAFDARKETAETLAEKFGSNIAFKEGKAVVQDNSKYAIKSTWFDKGIGKAIKPVIEGAVNAGKKDVIYEGLQEGLEEGSQFFIDKTLNNYYSWKYKGDNKNISDALLGATNQVFSKEGLESIFTGALSGSGQSLITNFFKNLNPDFKASKVKFKEGQEELAKDYNDLKTKFDALPITAKKKLVSIFNNQSVQGDLHNRIQNTNAAIGVQEIKENPQDEEQFNQALTHELFTLAEPYVKHQNLDILNQQFDEYKNMDAESFNKLFGTDVKDQSKLVDFYKDEFKKINDSYRKANNAFNTTFNDAASNAVYNDLRKELAFSLYNNDKLISDAKTLESNLGQYHTLLNNYAVNLPEALKDNNKRIKELESQVEYQPELSKEINRLKKTNDYIDSVLNKVKELKKEEYIKMLQDNIINPYKVANNITEHIDLDDKLNSLYYLAKIKDRINYQQDKINKILYSDDPVKFLKNAENDYQALVFNNIKEAIKKETPVKEVVKKEPVKPESKEVQAILNTTEQELPPTVSSADIFTKEPANTTPPPVEINIEDVDNEEGDSNNIESKDYQAAFLVDDDGNVLKDEVSFNNRAKVLSNILHSGISNEDFVNMLEFKHITVKTVDIVDYPLEVALLRQYPKEGISIKYQSIIVGFIPLDDGLIVDTNYIPGVQRGEISYSEFLQELKLNPVLFDKVKKLKGTNNKTPVLFNENVYGIDELIANHNNYNKTKAWIKTFVNGNILEDDFKEEAIKNNLIDFQAFFWGDIIGTVPLKDTAIYNEDLPIVNIEYDNKFKTNVVSLIQGKEEHVKSIDFYLNSLKDKAGNILPMDGGRFVFVRTKGVDGKIGWKYFNANPRPAINYTKETLETINTIEDLKAYLIKLRVDSSYTTTNEDLNGNKLDYRLSSFLLENGDFDIKIEVKLLDNQSNEISKIKLSNVTLKAGETKKQLLSKITDSIEKGTQDFKPTTPKIFRQEATIEETNKSIDTILINSYFQKAPGQVYSTMYLKINSLDNIELLIKKEVIEEPEIIVDDLDSKIKDIERRRQEELYGELTTEQLEAKKYWDSKVSGQQSDPNYYLSNSLNPLNTIMYLNKNRPDAKQRDEIVPKFEFKKISNNSKRTYIANINEDKINAKYDAELALLNQEQPIIESGNVEELPVNTNLPFTEPKSQEITLKDVLDNFASMGYVLSDKANDMRIKKGDEAFIESLNKKGLFTTGTIDVTKINPAIFVKGTIATRIKPEIKPTTQVSDTIKKCHNI